MDGEGGGVGEAFTSEVHFRRGLPSGSRGMLQLLCEVCEGRGGAVTGPLTHPRVWTRPSGSRRTA